MMIAEAEKFAQIPLTFDAQIDCAVLTVEEVIGLGPGSVIRTPRAAGESVNIRIGGQLIGQGELIVVENRLAVRISELFERI